MESQRRRDFDRMREQFLSAGFDVDPVRDILIHPDGTRLGKEHLWDAKSVKIRRKTIVITYRIPKFPVGAGEVYHFNFRSRTKKVSTTWRGLLKITIKRGKLDYGNKS